MQYAQLHTTYDLSDYRAQARPLAPLALDWANIWAPPLAFEVKWKSAPCTTSCGSPRDWIQPSSNPRFPSRSIRLRSTNPCPVSSRPSERSRPVSETSSLSPSWGRHHQGHPVLRRAAPLAVLPDYQPCASSPNSGAALVPFMGNPPPERFHSCIRTRSCAKRQ